MMHTKKKTNFKIFKKIGNAVREQQAINESINCTNIWIIVVCFLTKIIEVFFGEIEKFPFDFFEIMDLATVDHENLHKPFFFLFAGLKMLANKNITDTITPGDEMKSHVCPTARKTMS